MNVGLIAHDSKKKLMQNFCIAYKGILSKHNLYATGTTGKLIEEVTNLNIHKFLPGHLGGEQQMGCLLYTSYGGNAPFRAGELKASAPEHEKYSVEMCIRDRQMEDPKLAKGLVKREVIRVVTPGTITSSQALDETKNNYLRCV